jgi:hypothetical protein
MAQLQLWKESRGECHAIPQENWDYPNQERLKCILTIKWIHIASSGGHMSPKDRPVHLLHVQKRSDHGLIIYTLPRLTVTCTEETKPVRTCDVFHSGLLYLFLTGSPMCRAFAGIYFHYLYRVATGAIQVCTYNIECGGKMVPM